MNVPVEVRCIVCDKKFLKKSEANKRSSKRKVMGHHRITCSKHCVRKYDTIQRRIRGLYLNEIKRLKNKIKRLEQNAKRKR